MRHWLILFLLLLALTSQAQETVKDKYDISLIESPTFGHDLRMQLLSSAKENISLCYYSTNIKDEVAQDIFSLLLQKAKEGVQINILLDHLAGRIGKTGQILASYPNVTLSYYNPINLFHPIRSQYRLHDKFTIVDNCYLIVGGRNLEDRFFNPPQYDGKLALDRELFIRLKAPYSAKPTIFDEFNQYQNTLLASSKKVKGKIGNQKIYSALIERNQCRPPIRPFKEENFTEKTFSVSNLELFHHGSEPQKKEPTLFYKIRDELLSAEKCITLQSPYIVMDKTISNLLDSIGKIKMEKPLFNYEILTNSIDSSPNLLCISHYYAHRKKISALPGNLWEYHGDESIHAKSLIIDDKIIYIGTQNLDPRSLYLNTEMMIRIEDKDFATYFKSVLEQTKSKSIKVGQEDKKNNQPVTGKKFLIDLLQPISRLLTQLL